MAKECFGDYFIPPTGQRGRCPSGMKNEKDKEKETKETKRRIKLPIKPRQVAFFLKINFLTNLKINENEGKASRVFLP